jgi:hypothetical protein
MGHPNQAFQLSTPTKLDPRSVFHPLSRDFETSSQGIPLNGRLECSFGIKIGIQKLVDQTRRQLEVS